MSSVSEAFPNHSGKWGTDRGRYVSLVLIAILLCIVSFFDALPQQWNRGLRVVGVSFLAAAGLVAIRTWVAGRFEKQTISVLAAVLEQEAVACIIADHTGSVLLANTAAKNQLNAGTPKRLEECLRSVFANPAAILLRLQSRAQVVGAAEEDIVTRGQTIPVSVASLGRGRFSWRFSLDAPSPWHKTEIPGRDSWSK